MPPTPRRPLRLGHGVVLAVLALSSCIGCSSLPRIVPDLAQVPAADGVVYEPDPARHAIYQAGIARQRDLYERVITNGAGT